MLPHAIAAGLGELGKHGSLINRELGCSFRLSMITTDLPMQTDQPRDWGVEAICANCDMCVKWCPGDAIGHDKVTVRGSKRWVIDIEACAPYWGSYYACGICLEVCPFNAQIEAGKFRASLIDRINGIDRNAWTQQLRNELQIPWSHVAKPTDRRPGWRNRVRGSGEAAGLQHGIPAAGLPEVIYAQRRMMGLDPAANDD